MHTQEFKSMTIHHNGDYSGDVIIVVASEKITDFPKEDRHTVTLPFEELQHFIAQSVIDRRISQLQEETPLQVLGLE